MGRATENLEFAELDLETLQLASSSSVHDRTQFETKFDFDFSLQTSAQGGNKSYEVDLYLFSPQTLAMNAESYPTDAFYSDLTHMLRVRTPDVRYDRNAPPLASVERYFEAHLDGLRRQSLLALAEHDIKLFGCYLYTQLKKLQSDLNRILRRVRHTQNEALLLRFRERLASRVERVHREIRHYRSHYIWRIQNEPLLLDPSLRRALLLVDEYLSYRLESGLVNLHALLQPYGSDMEDLQHQLEAILTGEIAYREENIQGARAADTQSGMVPQERLPYRLGILKKYVSEVLFLETQRIRRDYIYRNFVAAFGAALAAAFATFANIQTVMMVTGREDLGLRLFTILMLGVIAYVFKDRIKDLSKDYFNARLKRWLPDYEVHMFYNHFDDQGQPIRSFLGSSEEYTRYLNRSSLPPEVIYIRELGHQRDLEPERIEHVLHYHKKVQFSLRGDLRDHFAGARVRRLHDVLRFDLSRFFAKLDDPEKIMSFFDPDKGIVSRPSPKVYHLNLIFRYTVRHLNGTSKVDVEYERVRIIINKKGIVRLETVVPRGEMGYSA